MCDVAKLKTLQLCVHLLLLRFIVALGHIFKQKTQFFPFNFSDPSSTMFGGVHNKRNSTPSIQAPTAATAKPPKNAQSNAQNPPPLLQRAASATTDIKPRPRPSPGRKSQFINYNLIPLFMLFLIQAPSSLPSHTYRSAKS